MIIGPGRYSIEHSKHSDEIIRKDEQLWYELYITPRSHSHHDLLHFVSIGGIIAGVIYVFIWLYLTSIFFEVKSQKQGLFASGIFVLLVAGGFQCYLLDDEVALPFFALLIGIFYKIKIFHLQKNEHVVNLIKSEQPVKIIQREDNPMNKSNVQYLPIVRKPHFNWEGIVTHWCDNNFFTTHFINSMHVVFPEGEKFFIRSVKAFADQIKNPELKERVKAFIGQETQHFTHHRNFWEVLQKQSNAVAIFERLYSEMAYGERETTRRKTLEGNKFSLAVTVALEHYTAVMAEIALENDSKILEGMPQEMVNLLEWHAAEEIEHRAVAFDVLKEVDDSYLLRIAGMLYATWVLAFYISLGQLVFMTCDKTIKLEQIPDQLFRFFKKSAPLVTGVISNVADFFRFDFHPEDKDNRHIAARVFQKMQGISRSA